MIKKAPNFCLGLFEYGGGPSTELKPVTIMQQGFYVFRFHLYQQKYQQYAKVPCFLAAYSGGYYKRLRRAISTKS